MKKYINLILILTILISCKDDSVVDSVGQDIFEKVITIPYELNKIEFEDLPYTIWRLAEPEKNPNPVDSNGIEVFIWGGKTHYHPLHLCQRMEWYLDSYYQSKNPYYLEWINKYHTKLMELGIEKENALFFPYDFDFALHGYNWDVMKAPWLSAMTQGIALMVHSRLFKFTNDSTYLELADKIFNSFFMMPESHDPWITMIDPNNYLWFEEYPDDSNPNYTLNGFIFCLYGIYEYYIFTNNEKAEFLLQAGIATVRNYIEKFRVKGEISYYCLKHKTQNWDYHLIHTQQLKTLYHFTNDTYFSDMADSFYVDYHK